MIGDPGQGFFFREHFMNVPGLKHQGKNPDIFKKGILSDVTAIYFDLSFNRNRTFDDFLVKNIQARLKFVVLIEPDGDAIGTGSHHLTRRRQDQGTAGICIGFQLFERKDDVNFDGTAFR